MLKIKPIKGIPVVLYGILIQSQIIRAATNSIKMPEQRTVPLISSLEEFDQKLPGFLNPNKKIAVLFDFDGTLAPIASNPDKAALPYNNEILLNKIAKSPNVFLGVISGRGLKDVQSRVGINGITYGGNHGLEIEDSDGKRFDFELPAEIKANYTAMVKELNAKVNKNNAWVEDKLVSLTYHYRHTPLDIKEAQKQLAIDIIKSHGFKANQAHEAIEAKPPVNWNKGEASLFILKKTFGDNWADKIQVIFAGDDTTDEDAMRALQGSGKTFRISENPEVQTYADFRLPNQEIINDLLQWIANVYAV